ncbi:MAG TPA: PfkB family carbohydrate kinase [Phycisphaerae bacterium]|nr:PfkB family carbohydrate kinase [Phycisphaerae bacterium]
MTPDRFESITSAYARLRVVLVGDIALDRYLEIDPALAETSIETGLPVRNVVRVRPQPGAGGNVLANLAALGPKTLAAVGLCGDDGEGAELRGALAKMGVDLTHFLARPDRMTFTYTKPLLVHADRPPEELSRLDLRSRTPVPEELEDEMIGGLGAAAADADVVVAMDQVPDPGCGVLTRRVRTELAALARAYPQKVFIADSRTSIAEFADVRIKVNALELVQRFGAAEQGADLGALAARWSNELGHDVFVTLGEDGVVAAAGDDVTHVPGIPADPPIDSVGAGDSVLASIAMALGAGATPAEAAELGNLAAAVTVRKIGTTGTATVEELAGMLPGAGSP